MKTTTTTAPAVNGSIPCPDCKGDGFLYYLLGDQDGCAPCRECNSTGEVDAAPHAEDCICKPCLKADLALTLAERAQEAA